MKRTILVIAALLSCVASYAQSKGDKFIAASINASFGSQNTESSDGAYTTTQESPLTTSVGSQAEFGYFVADNLRLALCLGVAFNSSPVNQSGGTWLKSNTIGFQINPNLAYYFHIADRLYYTPELGFSFETGSYKEDITPSTSYNANYSGWDIYANILALEFQVSPKLAFGVGIGSIVYANVKIEDKSSDAYFGNSQFLVDLNHASVHVRYYF